MELSAVPLVVHVFGRNGQTAIAHKFMGWLVGQKLDKNMIKKQETRKAGGKGIWIDLSKGTKIPMIIVVSHVNTYQRETSAEKIIIIKWIRGPILQISTFSPATSATARDPGARWQWWQGWRECIRSAS